jgi:undecaprenyl-diphosphatase
LAGPGLLFLGLFVGLFVALAAAARAAGGGALPGEAALLAAAGAAAGGGLVAAAALLAGVAAPLPWSGVVLAAAAVLWLRGARRAAVALVLAVAVAEGAALLAKAVVDRPRPAGAVLHDALAAGTAAFPSSHAARATAALGVLLATAWPRGGRTARTVAVLTAGAFLALLGLARLASGEHWPLDVLGGYVLGATAAIATRVSLRSGPPTASSRAAGR